MPLAIGALLVTGLVVQLAWPLPHTRDDARSGAATSLPATAAAPAAEYPNILARPLFNPARGAAGAAGAEQAASTSLADFTLVGVARVGGRGEAVLKGPGGEVVSLREGEALLGWRLAAVDQRGIVLSQGDARRTVPFSASAAPAAGPLRAFAP